MVISLKSLVLSNDVVVTVGICYISVTILTLDLLQDFGMCQYLGTGSIKSDFVAGGHQQEPEGQYGKSVVHVPVPPTQVP
jgi:hypothetical protein